jgi:hypothetical protein
VVDTWAVVDDLTSRPITRNCTVVRFFAMVMKLRMMVANVRFGATVYSLASRYNLQCHSLRLYDVASFELHIAKCFGPNGAGEIHGRNAMKSQKISICVSSTSSAAWIAVSGYTILYGGV